MQGKEKALVICFFFKKKLGIKNSVKEFTIINLVMIKYTQILCVHVKMSTNELSNY